MYGQVLAASLTRPRWNYLLMALILSCFGKPCLILTMIWDNHRDHFVSLLMALVTTSNIVGVKGKRVLRTTKHSVFMESSTLEATGVILCGHIARWILQLLIYFLVDPTLPVGLTIF